MSATRTVTLVIVATLAGWGAVRQRDPYRARLPVGTRDLSSVESPLRRLPSADRRLVVAYVTRSGGDVLPPRFADPDAPLTARTFAEAIALQRRFEAGQAVIDAQAARRHEEGERALAPLRAAATVELVDRAIESLGDPGAAREPSYELDRASTAKRAIDAVPMLVSTYRLRNAGRVAIDSVTGTVEVRAAGDGSRGGALLRTCWLEHRERLEVAQSVDLRCADRSQRAADSAYVATPIGALTVEWTPAMVAFAGVTLRPLAAP